MADILIVDDQDRYAELCRRTMPEHHYRGPVRGWQEAKSALERGQGRIDVVLLDVHFDIPEQDLVGFHEGIGARELQDLKRRQGVEILRQLRKLWPDLPVVLMTSRQELALESLPEGLSDEEYTYFLDDDVVDAQTLRGQIDGIVASRRGREADGPVYWGASMAMRRIRRKLAILARGRLPVVLLGPTGTGKSLIARHFVHTRSGRPGRFVAVDLSTIPTDLCAAHLFGAVKGSYTGSIADRVGAFEAASGGTLFLDEVGNLSSDAQKMLLSVLQEGVITRLGDLRERPVDVKLVVAANEDLRARVARGDFRADLYMRLNPATTVILPPLAERGLDQGRLLSFCLEQALARPYLRGLIEDYRQGVGLPPGRVVVVAGGAVPDPAEGVLHLQFPDRGMRLLSRHHWPGNLREFSMVAENAVLFALSELSGVPPGQRPDVVQVRAKLVRDMLSADPTSAQLEGDAWHHTIAVRPQETLNRVAVECERQYFEALWLEHEGSFAEMAALLLGDEGHARKVQLRFNQLGLKVRELKAQLRR
ncbi:MAG TPA: sigma-54-dependent Fis family transcriptional regulator [Deltaproteobacteria bacterium]|nr:sigma-54-dependent Fis family transcriptional regulator [Deltaproteobacteria bacterium]